MTDPATPEQAAAGRQIAYRIRAELVCCNVFQRVQDGEVSHGRIGGSHTLCYWGEASARIAETPEQWRNDPDDHDWSGLDLIQRRARRANQHQEQHVSDRIHAPFTEAQIAALNAYQRSGRMHPFTCGNEQHELHQTLIAERDGWRCPDDACDYRQTWAHAHMADPNFLSAMQFPGVAEHLAVFGAAERAYGSPALTELAKVRQQLRATEDDLGRERQRTADLTTRLTAAEQRVQALLVHEGARRANAAVPCGEILRQVDTAGSIDTYEDAAGDADARVQAYGGMLGEVLQAWQEEQQRG